MSADRKIGIVLFAIVAGYGYLITQLPAQRMPDDVGEALFPWLITVAVTLLGIALVIYPSDGGEISEVLAEEDGEGGHAASSSGAIATVIAMAAYVFALPYAGFLVSTTVFAAGLMRLGGSRSFVRDIAVAVLSAFVIETLFTQVLLVPLPGGGWFEW